MAFSPITAPATVIGLPGFNSATVADYGAKGDGTTDDLTALQAAVASGKNLYFDSSKTYLISGQLFLSNGQQLFFNRSTLKNVNQISDTTSTNIGTGNPTTNITVTNGSKWTVGQSITVYDGVNFDAQPHKILSIVGNVLNVGTAFTQGFPTGGTVYLTYYNIITVDNNIVHDLILDGNKSNWTFYRWQTTGGISMGGTNALINNPRILNEPGEGIVMFGTDNAVRRFKGDSFNGNGIHFSGATRPDVDGVTLKNMNLDTAVGHANGGVIWSNTIVDARVHNIYVENAITAIGSIDSFDNSDITVSKVIARGCTTAGVNISASSPNSAPLRVSLSDIKTYGCQIGVNIASDISFALSISSSTNASPIAVTTSVNHGMADGQPVLAYGHTTNTAVNGTWYGKATGNAANVLTLYEDEGLTVPVAGNGIGGATGNIIAQVANVSMNGVHCYDSVSSNLILSNVRDITGSNNQFVKKGGSGSTVNCLVSSCQNVSLASTAVRGGTYGFYVQDPQGVSRNIVLNGVAADSQYNAGISLPTANQQSLIVASNVISPDTTAVSTYDGLILGSNAAGVANSIFVPANVAAIDAGIAYGNSGIGLVNMVQTPSSSYRTMHMSGGSSNNMAILNMTSTAPVDGNASNITNCVGMNFDPYGNTINGLIPQSNPSTTTSAALQSFGPTGSPLLLLSPKGQGLVAFQKHPTGSQQLSSIAALTAAGSGASVSTNLDSDTMGTISLTTGTGSTSGQLVQLHTQYQGSTLQLILQPTNVAAAGLTGVYTTYDGGGNLLSIRMTGAPADGTTYTWCYLIFNAL